MARRKYIPKSRLDPWKHLAFQKFQMAKHFPCFTCSIQNRVLICTGEITPSEECDTYRIQIKLPAGMIPHVRILNPEIAPSTRIHMYTSGDLCLYKPNEQPWKVSDYIHKKIVPWIAEWLVYYELFKITGQWLGPEATHDSGPKEVQKIAS